MGYSEHAGSYLRDAYYSKCYVYFSVLHLLLIAVNGQECANTVATGSLDHDTFIVTFDHTFILAGYTTECGGIVVAWEFCYQISHHPMVSFYPEIWRITGTSASNTDYALVQINNVTYNPNGTPLDTYPCKILIFHQQISLLHQQDQLWDCILMF